MEERKGRTEKVKRGKGLSWSEAEDDEGFDAYKVQGAKFGSLESVVGCEVWIGRWARTVLMPRQFGLSPTFDTLAEVIRYLLAITL